MLSGADKEALRSEILDLGFDDARFTNLDPVGETRLREWIELGYHADMDWMKRSIDKRLDPKLVLEDACSVIMLGINYFPDDEQIARQTGFAKYSLYRDYHDTVLGGVRAIGNLLEERYHLASGDYRYYVDTGPVMERGWAASAGLGWRGKNGMLISKTHGNWLLLATVFVRLEIEPDSPLRKTARKREVEPRSADSELALLCGKCTRCMDKCPTGAIVEPGILDTRLCISYQTIENKGVIPVALRPKMGGRVYGCDICLDVCPWNRFAKAGRMQLLERRYAAGTLSLIDLLTMDRLRYQETFRKMPQKRTKLRGLKRNACIAAGNLHRCPDWWPNGVRPETAEGDAFVAAVLQVVLTLATDEEEALVRAHAVWAVYQLSDDADSLLADLRTREEDEMVLAEFDAQS